MIQFDDRPRWVTWRRVALASTALALAGVVAAQFAEGEAPTHAGRSTRASATSALATPNPPMTNTPMTSTPVEAAVSAIDRPAEPPALALPAAIPASPGAAAPAASQPATREELELRESQPDGSC